MIKLIIKSFIKDYENTSDTKVREKYGFLSGFIGIMSNFILFIVKLIIGTVMNSIAIISDAFNNLSDMASSFVTILGMKLSTQRPDKEHPFGHGRIEYIASLIVCFMIFLVGIELIKSSFDKIIHPEKIFFSTPLIIILVLSVLIKVWMYSYNKYMGNIIKSQVLIATSKDSLNDVVSTLSIITATSIGAFLPFSIDGYVGLLTALYILYSGYGVAKDTIDLLLGTSPDPELVNNIKESVLSGDGIIGIHDLIVHDYGPGRVMASVHAEVNANDNIIKIHEVIDDIEKQIFNEYAVHLVIHMDPLVVDCEKTNQIKLKLQEIIYSVNPELSFHDFRMTDGEHNINLIFDLCIPISVSQDEREKYITKISEELKKQDDRYNLVINIDDIY